MINYVGLDVSQKTTTLCIVDREGHRQWRGECVTSPEHIAQAVLQHAGAKASIGIETGPTTPWLVHELRLRGLDVICLDARHARAALRMQLNKTDRNDAEGLAQIMRTGWYRAVHVKYLHEAHLRCTGERFSRPFRLSCSHRFPAPWPSQPRTPPTAQRGIIVS
jgi:transposase